MSEIRTPMLNQRFWFEYHCWEDEKSSDAKLWYHSHQQCTIISGIVGDDNSDLSFDERCELGMNMVYKAKFDDGFESTVFEDELLDSPEGFCRPDPPNQNSYDKN